ncbi:hypothetical protein PybrP1_009660 [[Pythium] brassicae (nom. inval.)]|nr:hypothetical protein PybrP1_009660 [[Pythium] brassicae (nom. inval.)]
MAEPLAAYVALCTRLSRFVQLPSLSSADAAQLCDTCSALVAFYEQPTPVPSDHHAPHSSHSLLGGVSSAAIDDVVLLALHKLMLGVASASNDARVQERVVAVLRRVLQRSVRQIGAFSAAKLLSFVQSCVLFLPPPTAAADGADAEAQRKQASHALQSQPEELRLDVLASLQLLLTHRSPALRLAGGDAGPERTHFFAYLVSSLLHIAQHDKCRPAATLAVAVLTLVVDVVRDAPLLRQFFPGVSVGMWTAINAPKQSSTVVVAALQCLAQCMTLCISDAGNESASGGFSDAPSFSIEGLRSLVQQQQQRSHDEDVSSAAPLSAPGATAADPWLVETAVNIDIILSRLFGSQAYYHKSWRVRDAMAALCGVVVLRCRATLHDSFFRCYEELLVLRVDPIAEVAARARRVVRALQNELALDEWLRMVPALADRFQMHLSTLALKCATDHESASVRLMRKLLGYVSFLGRRLGPHVDAAMDVVFASLCRVFEFDAIDIDLVLHEQLREEGAGKALTTSHFQKRLRFFHDEESVRTATQLLRAIGSVATPALFVDCAFSALTRDVAAAEDPHAEVFVVLNGFLRAYVMQRAGPADLTERRDDDNDDDDTDALLLPVASADTRVGGAAVDVHLVGRILEDLLVLDAWSEHAVVGSSSSTGRATSRKALQAAVSQRALMVECVGICVEILHRDFNVFLLHTLYPLVEKLGSPDVEVEHAALAALRKIYFVGGYASVEALFEANMDYFVDALCSRLEHLEQFPRTALVVEGLLRHTKIAALPLVDEVARALLRSVDLYQDSPYTSSLLRALKLLLSSMAAEDGLSSDRTELPVTVDLELEPPGALLKQFIKEIRILTSERTGDDEDEDEDETPAARVEELGSDGEEEPSDEVKMKGAMPVEFGEQSPIDSRDEDAETDHESGARARPASPYTALIVEVLDRSGHFLSESDPIACCLVLAIIEEGVVLLRASRTELLPLIHRIWSTIVHRFAATNTPILVATIRLVTTLATVAGDFIGDRFVEGVWPALRTHLRAMQPRESSAASSRLTRSMLLLSTEGGADEAEGEQPPRARESDARTRRTHATQLLLASLECLVTVSSRSSAVSLIVPEAAAICRQFLSSEFPGEVVASTTTLFRALAELNGDEVFCALAPLAVWTPPSPPSARFPAYTPEATALFYKAQQQQQQQPPPSRSSGAHTQSGGLSRETALHARDTAALLIRQLQRQH